MYAYIALSLIAMILLKSYLGSKIEPLRQLSSVTPANLSALSLAIQNPYTFEVTMLPLVVWLQRIAAVSACTCGIVAMVTDYVNKGLALLAGVLAAFVVFYFITTGIERQAMQDLYGIVNKQSQELQQQYQKLLGNFGFQQPPPPPPQR